MRERKPGADSRNLIDVNDPEELRLWTMSLGVSEVELRRAVEVAGNRADKVREYLLQRG